MRNIRGNIIKKTQEKTSEDIGISRSFISHIESPNVDYGVSLDTLFIISQKYNFDIRDFFDGYERLMNTKAVDNKKIIRICNFGLKKDISLFFVNHIVKLMTYCIIFFKFSLTMNPFVFS